MSPFPILLLVFFTVPLVEIYVLIEVGSLIGPIITVSLVVFTAVLGASLMRFQGLTTLRRFQMSLARGEVPALEMLEGVALIMGGALLLTPGFVTDAIGFLCLVPPLRQLIIKRWVARHVIVPGMGPGPGMDSGPARRRTIEGQFKREDD